VELIFRLPDTSFEDLDAYFEKVADRMKAEPDASQLEVMASMPMPFRVELALRPTQAAESAAPSPGTDAKTATPKRAHGRKGAPVRPASVQLQSWMAALENPEDFDQFYFPWMKVYEEVNGTPPRDSRCSFLSAAEGCLERIYEERNQARSSKKPPAHCD
jgi:hypothetical protein